jgi:hypothetical protein
MDGGGVERHRRLGPVMVDEAASGVDVLQVAAVHADVPTRRHWRVGWACWNPRHPVERNG